MIKISIRQEDVRRLAKQLTERARRMVPNAMAKELKQSIIDNSEKGVDIRGRKMKKYTPEYTKRRTAKGLQTDVVDLRDTGSLLDDQTTNGKTLRPKASDAKKAEGNMKHRKFYPEQEQDVSPRNMKRLVKAGEKALEG